MTDTLSNLGKEHALKIGGYGVHCACGYYFDGFGPNPRVQKSSVKNYGYIDETLFEHIARIIEESKLAKHCSGCSGWVSTLTHDEGYECFGY